MGKAFGGVEASYLPDESLGITGNTREWRFHSGINFTARFFISHPKGGDLHDHSRVSLGILGGIDMCLVPRDGDTFQDFEGTFPANEDELNDNAVYLAPSIILRPSSNSVQFLLAAGLNYRIWNKSHVHEIPLTNSFGTSLIALVKHRALWTGVSIHHNRVDTHTYDGNTGRLRFSVQASSTTIWFNVGYSG
jgi:hypothetical protein